MLGLRGMIVDTYTDTKGFIKYFNTSCAWRQGMCEFKVILDGEEVFRDVVYAKAYDEKVMVRDVIGETREFQNCRIITVDVNNAQLILSSLKAPNQQG